MYDCYIDESGHCGKRFDPDQPVEVVCGVLIDLTKLFKTQREQRFLIQFLQNKGIPLNELKASHIYGGRKHWENVSSRIRDGFFTHILKWMSSRCCKIIVCPIYCAKFFQKNVPVVQYLRNYVILMRLVLSMLSLEFKGFRSLKEITKIKPSLFSMNKKSTKIYIY